MIKKEQINLDNITNQKLIHVLTNGIIYPTLKGKYVIDIIVYLDGPQYWIELCMDENNRYNVENYKRIK